MKTSENQIVISSLINRADHLNAKVTQVNYMLAYKCQVFKIGYLDNSNICLQHLQGGGRWGGLHLNEDGAHILKQNFINIINTWYGKAYAGAFRAPLTANNTTAVEKPVDTVSEQGETEDAFAFIEK